jgi:hypothetical protein
MSAAHDLGYPSSHQGAGRVDAWKAVQTATHTGPSFLIAPNSLAIGGPVAAPFTVPLTITNTGPTVQSYSVDAAQSQETGLREWAGTVESSALQAFHVTVRPGLERIVGAVYWNYVSRFREQGSSQEVALRVALYDPRGRFVNRPGGRAALQAVLPEASISSS